jgi:hypothetical protein
VLKLYRLFLLATLLTSLLSFNNAYAETFTASTDKNLYAFGSTVNVTGKVPSFKEGEVGTIKILTPKNRIFVDDKFTPEPDGSFTYSFKLQGNIIEEGTWVIRLHYNVNNKIMSFEVQETVKEDTQTQATTPASSTVTLNASTDKDEYLLGDTVTITGTVSPVSDKNIVVQVFNAANFAVNFAQLVPATDGTFEHKFPLKGTAATVGNYTINVTYMEIKKTLSIDVVESSDEEETETGENQEPEQEQEQEEPLQKVTASRITITDTDGSEKASAAIGEQILIRTNLTNNQNNQQEFAFIVQVKNADGEILMLSWFKGILDAEQTAKVEQSWVSEEKGRFEIEAFVWKDIAEPEPLSDTITSAIRVL